MPDHEQVLRFAVGSADGPRSRTWRLWVPKRKSDVYISGRRLGNSVKVSLHEPGPARFALTDEWVRVSRFQAPRGRDRRLAIEWERPRPRPPLQVARPLALIVPWDEVRETEVAEAGEVVFVAAPPEGSCVHFDIVYTPPVDVVTGHPGARSMRTTLVGEVLLENRERVFVTSLVRPMEEPLLRQVERMRTAPVLDAGGNLTHRAGMLAFGDEPNPDADDGTRVGVLLDVTRPGP